LTGNSRSTPIPTRSTSSSAPASRPDRGADALAGQGASRKLEGP
jgi:hypothetical protein